MKNPKKEKLNLEPTAAYVIGMAENYYKTNEITARYIESLDLSSGANLTKLYKEAGIYELASELVCNRKFIIKSIIDGLLNSCETQFQIVILASGMAPLSLEVLADNVEKIRCIYEADVSSFNKKESIYKTLHKDAPSKIKFIQEDITSNRLLKKLETAGYNSGCRTILILEGITHYITQDRLIEILSQFKSVDKANFTVIEYGLSYETLNSKTLSFAKQAYKIVEEVCKIPTTYRFTVAELENKFKEAGGKLTEHYPASKSEKIRLGKNIYFFEDNYGWLECVVGNI